MPEVSFVPSEAEVASVRAWFAEWDKLALAGDIEALADRSLFPVNTLTTDEQGNGVAESWDRPTFIERMTAATAGAEGVSMMSVRTPHFISADLVMVVTEAEIIAPEKTFRARYGDILVKRQGSWVFQTMLQAGW